MASITKRVLRDKLVEWIVYFAWFTSRRTCRAARRAFNVLTLQKASNRDGASLECWKLFDGVCLRRQKQFKFSVLLLT